MTFFYKENGIKMSRCLACDADLIAKRDGKLYCSNEKCRLRRLHASLPYPTYKGAMP